MKAWMIKSKHGYWDALSKDVSPMHNGTLYRTKLLAGVMAEQATRISYGLSADYKIVRVEVNEEKK